MVFEPVSSQSGILSGIEALADAAEFGIDVMRVAAIGYWPVDMALWESDPNRYWAAMDRLLKEARQSGIRLVLVIYWNSFLFPDLASRDGNLETRRSLPFSESQSRKQLFAYVSELVARYADRSTVLAWEISNELNLTTDISMKGRKTIVSPCSGTPSTRTLDD